MDPQNFPLQTTLSARPATTSTTTLQFPSSPFPTTKAKAAASRDGKYLQFKRFYLFVGGVSGRRTSQGERRTYVNNSAEGWTFCVVDRACKRKSICRQECLRNLTTNAGMVRTRDQRRWSLRNEFKLFFLLAPLPENIFFLCHLLLCCSPPFCSKWISQNRTEGSGNIPQQSHTTESSRH